MTSTKTQDRVTVGIVSDTHGWLDPALLDAFAGAERILHAGDVGDLAVLEALEQVAPVSVVRGNIDGGPLRDLPLTEVVEVAGKRLALLHIAGNPRRPRKAARQLLAAERPDAIIVGHSHIPVVGRVGGALWINPGAAGRQGFHDERFALLLHITPEGSFEMDRVHLGPRSRQS